MRDDGPAADLGRVAAALAEGEVLEDLLRGIASLRRGDMGRQPRTLADRVLRRREPGASIMGAAWGPDQLMKSARAARPFLAALDELAPTTVATTGELLSELRRLHIDDVYAVLNDPQTVTTSAALTDVADRVGRAMASLAQARMRLTLEAMRAGQPDDAAR